MTSPGGAWERASAGPDAGASHPAALRRRMRRAAGPLLLLTLLVVLPYHNVLFEGETLVSSANAHPFDYRSARLDRGDASGPALMGWHDQGAPWWQWEPAGQFFSRAYRRGRLPLWDPSSAGGADAHVNLTQGQYFPPYLVLLLLGNTPAQRDGYMLLLLFASGAACLNIGLRNGFHPAAGLTMAAVYMLGGALTANINSVVGQAAAMLPFMVLVTDWMVQRPTWRRTAAAAAVYALSISASFIPVIAAGFILLPFLLAAHLLVRDPSEAPTRQMIGLGTTRLAVAVVLGLSLAAFLLVPVLVASRADPEFGRHYGAVAEHHVPLADLQQLVSRQLTWHAWGYSADPAAPSRHPSAGFYILFYVGLLPLLAGVMAFAAPGRPARRLAVFFAASGAFVALKLAGVPPAQWIAHLPLVRQVHFIPYACAALNLAVAGLAGVGVESLVRRPPPRRAVAAAALVFVALAIPFYRTAAQPVASRAVWRDTVLEGTRLAVLAVGLLVLLWLRGRGRLAGGTTGALTLSLVVLELGPLAFATRYRRADVWNEVPVYVKRLQDLPHPVRIHAVDDSALTANIPQGIGLQGLSSRHAINPPRINAFLRRYFETSPVFYPVVTGLLPSARVVLDLLNVEYLVTFDPALTTMGRLRALGFVHWTNDGAYRIYENPSAWPRAYVASRYRVVGDPAAALADVATLAAPDEVILESRPQAAVSRAPGQAAPAAACRIRRYRENEVRIVAETPQPAVLVLSDTFADGWRAEVNGRSAPVFPANFAFRGVEIPAGRSVVTFRYRPPGLTAGLLLSAAALAAVAFMAQRGREGG